MSIKTALLFAMNIFRSRNKGSNEFRHHMLSSILGIALSLIPVIVVLEAASGMIEGITSRFLEFDTFHFQARLFYDLDQAQRQKIIDEVKTVPQVTGVIVERQGLGLIFSGSKKNIVNVRAVPADLYATDPGFRHYVTLSAGKFALDKPRSVVIGRSLADELRLKVGDTLKILTYSYDTTGGETRITPRPNRLTITGIYSIGYQELDKAAVFISFAAGRHMLAFNQSEEYLKIKVADPYKNFTAMKDKIRESITNTFDVGGIHSWYELKENHYKAYETTKWLLLFIMMLIVLVAAVNISSSMVMVVMDKVQEIGILKSMGAGPETITLSFVIVGFLSGFIGTVCGMFLGLVIAVNINEVIQGIEVVINILISFGSKMLEPVIGPQHPDYIYLLNPEFYLERIPIRLEFQYMIIIGFTALFLSVCFAYLPARMAGRIKPLEVIRKH
jgi:lipoprotein-releasing system permease protein